jgi:ribonuclease HI
MANYPKKGKSKFYAVSKGSECGIYNDWSSCKEVVNGVACAKYQSFTSLADAVEFMNQNDFLHDSIVLNIRDKTSGKSCTFSLKEYCSNYGVDIPTVTKAPYSPDPNSTVNIPIINIDGACVNNGVSDAVGGVGVYWGPDHHMNLSRRLPDESQQPTNNRAELYAAIEAVKQAKHIGLGEIIIRSDSEYVVEGATSYFQNWKKTGELKTRKNRDLWIYLDSILDNIQIQWSHVKGHSGDPDNCAADLLANNGTQVSDKCIDAVPAEYFDVVPDVGVEIVQASAVIGAQLNNNTEVVNANGTHSNAETTTLVHCVVPGDRGVLAHNSNTETTIDNIDNDNDNATNDDAAPKNVAVPATPPVHGVGSVQVNVDHNVLHNNSNTETIPVETIPVLHNNSNTETIPVEISCHSSIDNLQHRQSKDTVITSATPKTNNYSAISSHDPIPSQDGVATRPLAADHTIPERLSAIEQHLAQMGNFKDAIRDIEKTLLDKLVKANFDNAQLVNNKTHAELCIARKEIGDARNQLGSLRSELKDKIELISSMEEIIAQSNKTQDVSLETNICQSCHTLKDDLAIMSGACIVQEEAISTLRQEVTMLKHELATKGANQLALQGTLERLNEKVSDVSHKIQDLALSRSIPSVQADILGTNVSSSPSTSDKSVNFEHPNRYANLYLDDTNNGITTDTEISDSPMNVALGASSSPTGITPSGDRTNTNVPPSDTLNAPPESPKSTTPSDDHRFDLDVLIIGNSHTKNIAPAKMYRNQSIVVHTLKEKSIKGAYDYVKVCPHRPKVVVLLVADNCVVNTSVETCVDSTRHLVTLCKQKFPDSTVCLSQVLPRRMDTKAQSMSHKTKADQYNCAAADLGVVIINQETLSVDDRDSFLRDGVHLTAEGLSTIIRNIKLMLNPILGLKSYDQYQLPGAGQPAKNHHRQKYQPEGQSSGGFQPPPRFRQSPGNQPSGGFQPPPRFRQSPGNQSSGSLHPPPILLHPPSSQSSGSFQPPPIFRQSPVNQSSGSFQPPPIFRQSSGNQSSGSFQTPPIFRQSPGNQSSGSPQPPPGFLQPHSSQSSGSFQPPPRFQQSQQYEQYAKGDNYSRPRFDVEEFFHNLRGLVDSYSH